MKLHYAVQYSLCMDKMFFLHNFPPEFPLLYAVKYELKKYSMMGALCARDWRERRLGELVVCWLSWKCWKVDRTPGGSWMTRCCTPCGSPILDKLYLRELYNLIFKRISIYQISKKIFLTNEKTWLMNQRATFYLLNKMTNIIVTHHCVSIEFQLKCICTSLDKVPLLA